MRVVDSRRLRGPNLQTRGPAAIAEVALEAGETAEACVAAWREAVARVTAGLGWPAPLVARPFPGGIALVLPAPIDVLMEATEINELAIRAASDAIAGRVTEDLEAALADLVVRMEASRSPALLALQTAARQRDLPLLVDDESVTLGMAAKSVTYPMAELPSPDAVPWDTLGRIPVALVTGTNGKTTTVRLIARMATLAGRAAGHTSTDGISVGETVVEEGDWTGPEAARLVLRRPDVDMAILETARGGILRRGLAVDRCDVALVTNVTSDHLGEFGVCDLPTMARAKGVVGTIVGPPHGRVVLGGDDPLLVELAPTFVTPVVLFATSEESPAVQAHLAHGGELLTVQGGAFVRLLRGNAEVLCRVEEAPITFGGAARHNIANALAAAAVAFALGLPATAISEALRTFGSRAEDNPGRGQVVRTRYGVRVLLDYGHNPAGLRELFHLARTLVGKGGRVLSVHTQPGDRTEEDTKALTLEIALASPRWIVLWESDEYRRGRAPGEIAGALRRTLVAAGFDETSIADAYSEADAIGRALAVATPADVVVVAPHIERATVSELLQNH